MKFIEKYRDIDIYTNKDAFEYIINNLKETIRTYDFFVAWEKVLKNVSNIEIALNILNTIIGKDNIAEKFKELIKKYPEVVPVIPILIAYRDTKIKIADIEGDIEYAFNKKKSYTDEEIDKIVDFSEKCGLLKVMGDKSIKNLVDYTLGVEVGLDTNARKNRSGFAMENLTEVYVKSICDNYGFRYLSQARADTIKDVFGKDVSTDKANRYFDFAIDTGEKLYLIEVNYYGGGGSKLKAVAGEFCNLFSLVKNDNTEFIWVTDGRGWLTAKRPLLEAFEFIDYILNIEMLKKGLLEEILVKGL